MGVSKISEPSTTITVGFFGILISMIVLPTIYRVKPKVIKQVVVREDSRVVIIEEQNPKKLETIIIKYLNKNYELKHFTRSMSKYRVLFIKREE